MSLPFIRSLGRHCSRVFSSIIMPFGGLPDAPHFTPILRMMLAPLLSMAVMALAGSAYAAGEVIQPRSFGYLIGDMLEQRVRLDGEPQDFIPAELPPIGRVGLALMRRSVTEERDSKGDNWLVLRYQIVNAPQQLTTWQIPPVRLTAVNAAATLEIPAWSFSVSPFTSPEQLQTRGAAALRADQLPAQTETAPLDRRIMIASGVLVAVVLAWAGWASWRVLNQGRQLPFARAWRDVRRLPDGEPSGWRRLQHALNDTAGQVVRLNTLDRLIDRAPYLAGERGSLEQFCRETNALFFSRGATSNRLSVRDLARRLHLLERRHAR